MADTFNSIARGLGLNISLALHPTNGNSCSGTLAQQKRTPLPRTVVEFEEVAGAAAVLAARQWVALSSGRSGQHSSAAQQLLPAAGIGYLKPCTCRNKRQCMCPGYVR
jgi:hypothetical protein